MSDPTFQILLYYNYTHIKDPQELMETQRQLCQDLGLKGRIIIATEGVNGTVEGLTEQTEIYAQAFMADPRFANTHIKRSVGTGNAFPKLSVKVRDEIVSGHLGDWNIDPNQITGQRLSPAELHDWFESNREFYIVDMRNDYEHIGGHFNDSILPKLGHFRDLPTILPDLAHLKHKTVVTVCTGGVRCEKASGFLVQHGFSDVYQLDGGIVSYMEQFPNQHFLGQLYVFDNRILMGFNTDAPEYQMVGRCNICNRLSEHYINCANLDCHKHVICCTNCLDEDGQGYCSLECREIIESKIAV